MYHSSVGSRVIEKKKKVANLNRRDFPGGGGRVQERLRERDRAREGNCEREQVKKRDRGGGGRAPA